MFGERTKRGKEPEGRKRRMRAGTILSKRVIALRQGTDVPGSALVECARSRRSTVMLALRRAAGVTHEYQSDSSSKRPASSVACGLPEPEP